MRPQPDSPTLVDTITDGDISVRVLMDTDPTMRAILVHLDDYSQELHLPLSVAPQVVEAMTRALDSLGPARAA